MSELDAVRAGDAAARDQWIAAWWPRVYRMALALTGQEADAEDLAQETLMAALGAVAGFRGDSSESTWLYAILVRTSRRRARRDPPARESATARPPAVEEALALLARLPEGQRKAAALFYVDDLSVAEVAKALGIPKATVRWRLFRARQVLKRTLHPVPGTSAWKGVL